MGDRGFTGSGQPGKPDKSALMSVLLISFVSFNIFIIPDYMIIRHLKNLLFSN
jgi:hypothetical protein